MESFDVIYDRAAERKGGPEGLEALLPKPKTPEELAATPDDRYLSAMTKRIFQAGFVWRVVEKKWPDFERAFWGFDPHRLAHLPEEELHDLTSDPGIIRNWPKIKTAHANARFVLDVAAEHGGFGKFVADWPLEDITGLWDVLKKRGSRLGGSSGPMVLRMMGKDTFVFSDDVVMALVAQGIVDGRPTSKTALKAAGDAFNEWRAESGRHLCEISRILSCSVGENYRHAVEEM